MEATRLILLRHGETAWNVDTRIQGQLDIPLNALGRRQAQCLAQALADEAVAAIYASDLERARETAEAVARRLGLAVRLEPRLRERAFGSFEGRTFADLDQNLPDQALRWRRRDPDFAPEGGENLVDFRHRVIAVTAELAARHPGEQLMLVAHGGLMDVLYRAATGQALQAPRTWYLGNAAINRVLWTPQGFTLIGWGDVSHLRDLALDGP